MEHSVAAYLARLPKNKAEQLWQEREVSNEITPHIDPEWIEILRLRLIELNQEQQSP